MSVRNIWSGPWAVERDEVLIGCLVLWVSRYYLFSSSVASLAFYQFSLLNTERHVWLSVAVYQTFLRLGAVQQFINIKSSWLFGTLMTPDKLSLSFDWSN